MNFTKQSKSMLCVLGLCVSGPGAALAQSQIGVTSSPAARQGQDSKVQHLGPELLYRGWRARLLIGQQVTAREGDQQIGTVRDLIVDADGRAEALIVETSGTAYMPQAVYRIRWKDVDPTPYRSGVLVDRLGGDPQDFALFPGSEGVRTLPREFRLSEILGDYARLQSGYGFGIVTDAIFTPDGRLSAVLVSRDAASGGGTMAYPFGGTQGPWDPGMSYYGLPFVTIHQAEEAGLKVDPHRFNDAAL